MDLSKKIVLVTGANRGIGKALVESLLKEPVAKIYASARNIGAIPNFHDSRIVPLSLDITSDQSIEAAVLQAQDVNVLFNNAGILHRSTLIDASRDSIEQDMNTNFYGTINVTKAFVPLIEKNGLGLIANTISVAALGGVPRIAGYSASKAALFSATQSLRAELRAKNIRVYGIFPGPIDTDMAAGIDMEKASPIKTAKNIIDAIKDDIEDIFPDIFSQRLSQLWFSNPKAVEVQLASS